MPGSEGALDILDVLGLLTGSLATWQGIVSLGAAFFHLLVSSAMVLNCQGGENWMFLAAVDAQVAWEALQVLVHSAGKNALVMAKAPSDGPVSGDV